MKENINNVFPKTVLIIPNEVISGRHKPYNQSFKIRPHE